MNRRPPTIRHQAKSSTAGRAWLSSLARLVLLLVLLPTSSVAYAIDWKEIKLSGRLLLGKLKITSSWSCITPEQASEELFSLANNVLVPQDNVVRVLMETITLGNKRTNILLLDKSRGYAVLQRERLRIKARKPNYKVERYAPTQMIRMERTPSNRAERKLPYTDWSNEATEQFNFGDREQAKVMTEPYALLFILAASNIAQPGDRSTYHVYAGNRILLLDFEATEWATNEDNSPLIVIADTKSLNVDANADAKPYKWFGMQGAIRLSFDPQTRITHGMTGSSRVGKIKLSLVSHTKADTNQCQ